MVAAASPVAGPVVVPEVVVGEGEPQAVSRTANSASKEIGESSVRERDIKSFLSYQLR